MKFLAVPILLLLWHLYRLTRAVYILTSTETGWRERVACRQIMFGLPAQIPNPQPWERNIVFSRTEQTVSVIVVLALLAFLLSACSYPLYPSTAGSHAAPSKVDQGARYVVWSNHPAVGQYITGILLSGGYPVVERSRLNAIFAEQKLRLSHARDEDVLRVGRLVGATQVIFAEVRGLEVPIGMFARMPAQSVSVRAVAVESGEVRWAGLASYPEPSSNPEQSVIALAHWAMYRATCQGTWEEPTAKVKGGCQEARKAVKAVEERSIWGELWWMERK